MGWSTCGCGHPGISSGICPRASEKFFMSHIEQHSNNCNGRKRYSFEYKCIAKLEKVLRTQNPSKICKCGKSEKSKYLVAILSADLEWSDLDGSGISWCLGGMIGELITCLYNNALIICQCISTERENNFRLIPQ